MKSISFSNLKGGSGKSSITLEVANYFSSLGKNVVIIDADIGQQTLSKAREFSENPSYDVLNFDPSLPIEHWHQLLNNIEAYDYAFFDIPGSVHQQGVLSMLQMMDKIIVVTKHTPKDLSATAEFINILRRNNITGFKLLFNMLRPYRDQDHRALVEELKTGKSGVTARILRLEPSVFFQRYFLDEQAAIEKSMEVGSTHKKIIERYVDLFNELETFINTQS